MREDMTEKSTVIVMARLGGRRRCNQRGVVDSRDHAAGGGATHVVPALLESCVSLQQYSKTVSHGRP